PLPPHRRAHRPRPARRPHRQGPHLSARAAPPPDRNPGPAAAGSARVVLDDELLVHRYHDLLALGAVKQEEPQVAEVYVEVGGGGGREPLPPRRRTAAGRATARARSPSGRA